MLKFCEFAADVKPLDGDKVKIIDVLKKPLIVLNYKIRNSLYAKGNGRYATIQVEVDEERKIIFTGSGVLIEQLEQYGDRVPFETTIIKIDRFYTFS